MFQILCVLAATIAYGTATGHCEGSQAGLTTVTFQSSSYSDMRQVLAREPAGTVSVKASLGFPNRREIAIPPSSSFTASAAIATPTKALSRPNCARRASPH